VRTRESRSLGGGAVVDIVRGHGECVEEALAAAFLDVGAKVPCIVSGGLRSPDAIRRASCSHSRISSGYGLSANGLWCQGCPSPPSPLGGEGGEGGPGWRQAQSSPATSRPSTSIACSLRASQGWP